MSAELRFSLGPVGSPAELAREWSVFDSAGGTSFFTSWVWIGAWLRLLPNEVEPLLLRVVEAQRTVAMAILVRRRNRRRLVVASRQIHFNATGDERFDCLGLEYNGFATDGIERPGLWRAFLAWFRSGRAAADELLIAGVREGGDEPECRACPGLLHRVQRIPCFEIELAGLARSGDDPSAALSRNARQQLNRAMRFCAAAGPLAIDETRDREEALAFFEAMKSLHIVHWTRRGKPHAFRFPMFERFHQSVIADGIGNASVELLRIRAGETVLGYLYNFRQGGRVYAYQSGFDDLDRRRPGYVCHALAIRRAAMRGDLVYDFMAGSNRLKRTFASREYGMGWHVVQQRLTRFRAENAMRAAKQWVLQR